MCLFLGRRGLLFIQFGIFAIGNMSFFLVYVLIVYFWSSVRAQLRTSIACSPVCAFLACAGILIHARGASQPPDSKNVLHVLHRIRNHADYNICVLLPGAVHDYPCHALHLHDVGRDMHLHRLHRPMVSPCCPCAAHSVLKHPASSPVLLGGSSRAFCNRLS